MSINNIVFFRATLSYTTMGISFPLIFRVRFLRSLRDDNSEDSIWLSRFCQFLVCGEGHNHNPIDYPNPTSEVSVVRVCPESRVTLTTNDHLVDEHEKCLYRF
jgi:hypothetical protein